MFQALLLFKRGGFVLSWSFVCCTTALVRRERSLYLQVGLRGWQCSFRIRPWFA